MAKKKPRLHPSNDATNNAFVAIPEGLKQACEALQQAGALRAQLVVI